MVVEHPHHDSMTLTHGYKNCPSCHPKSYGFWALTGTYFLFFLLGKVAEACKDILLLF